MGKARANTSAERAERDVEVDLGGGYSVIYRAGDVIDPKHRGLPTKAAKVPTTFTTQDEDDGQRAGDLASDRLKGTVVG